MPIATTNDHIVFRFQSSLAGDSDLGSVSIDDGAVTILLDSRFDERDAAVSPDGRWLAYTSDESGQFEVYVRPFMAEGPRWLISTNGGREPVWSPDGAELFYLESQSMMAVTLSSTEARLDPGRPSELFEWRYAADAPSYDVAPDGESFIMIRPTEDTGITAPTEIRVVVNWLEELERLVPTENEATTTRQLPSDSHRPKIVGAMSLSPGHKLAHYEILEPIGKGGMGEVYRARDGKLGRDVAIKVLPDEFAQDTERLRRFQREAKVLASLNHPNIASIYGLEQSGSTHYLVLELVPGETLAERMARGPIPADEALEIASKITEALEAAHERGIVHRDLKPPTSCSPRMTRSKCWTSASPKRWSRRCPTPTAPCPRPAFAKASARQAQIRLGSG